MLETSKYSTEYKRGADKYDFTTVDNTPVTALSFNTWEDYYESLKTSAFPDSGYVVSPELITLPPVINGPRGQLLMKIQERVLMVREISLKSPNSLFLLGTPTIDDSAVVRNSLVAIKDGGITGYIDKRVLMWPDEMAEFSTKPRTQAGLLKIGHAALICSDIISAISPYELCDTKMQNKLLFADTSTLIASCCWAVSRGENEFTNKNQEERFGGALEYTVGKLFEEYKNLKDIIIVDRSMPISTVESYTAQFKRI